MKLQHLTQTFQKSVLTLGMAFSGFAMAQAPAAPPAAAIPPTWAQGRTPEQVALNLVPHPPGMTALPVSDIQSVTN